MTPFTMVPAAGTCLAQTPATGFASVLAVDEGLSVIPAQSATGCNTAACSGGDVADLLHFDVAATTMFYVVV